MGMTKYDDPLHIISAQLSECGLTLAQRAVDGKSNEISAVQELLKDILKKVGAVLRIKMFSKI